MQFEPDVITNGDCESCDRTLSDEHTRGTTQMLSPGLLRARKALLAPVSKEQALIEKKDAEKLELQASGVVHS